MMEEHRIQPKGYPMAMGMIVFEIQLETIQRQICLASTNEKRSTYIGVLLLPIPLRAFEYTWLKQQSTQKGERSLKNSVPYSMTSSPFMKNLTTCGARTMIGITRTRVVVTADTRVMSAPLLALFILSAPQFWATKVIPANPMHCIGRNKSWSTLLYAVHPPITSAPN